MIDLMKDIPNEEMQQMKTRILDFMSSRIFHSQKHPDFFPYISSFYRLDRSLGFAYTSTSSFAGLWICNDILYFDCEGKIKVRGFAMTTSKFVVAVCEDNDENMFYVYI